MNNREKLMAIAVALLVGVFVAGFGIRAVILKPLKEIDKTTARVREKIQKLQQDRRDFFAAEDKIKKYGLTTFADTLDEASAASGEILTRQILQAGLQESEFTRLPVSPRPLRGGSARELGWSVQGEGPMVNVLNLLFLLEESPYLHHVDSISFSPGDSPGTIRVHLRYVTLVLDPPPDIHRNPLTPKFALESPERQAYDPTIARDLLRPYIKRPPPSAVPGVSPGAPTSAPGSPPGPESFRVVSLSEWEGQPEVHVRDLINQKTARYRPGDPLAGGTITMVDYRPLPMPGREYLQSFSRVIVRIGTEYWAIERGKTLAEKRKLPPGELPAELAKAQ